MRKVLILLAMASMLHVQAANLFVRIDGDDAQDGLSWATAKSSIQLAIDAAQDGDTVKVAQGL